MNTGMEQSESDQPPEPPRGSWWARVRHSHLIASTVLVVKAAVKSFGVNRHLELAATLGFYGFLSLMPLLLLTVLGLGHVLRSSEQVLEVLSQLLAGAFPAFNVALLDDIATVSGGGALGLLGVGLLLLSMTPLAGALRSAMARVFKLPMRTPFFRGKLLDLAAVLAFLVLFMALALVKVFAPRLGVGLSAALLPFVLSVAFIGLFFRVFAPVRLNLRQVLLGAVSVTLLWTLMRHLFVMFVAINPDYGYAFGSLKALFLVIVWVYYSFAALLLGAEIVANTYRRDALLLHSLFTPGKAAGTRGRRRLLTKFERVLGPGEVLFREGEAGHAMYVVLEGEVRISGGGHDLAVMKTGQYFGEMSLLGLGPRTATATAVGGARVAEIDRGNFDLLVRENPALVRGLVEELARRLDKANRRT